jgi:puromycin-sensitive aminopeptidase
LSIEPDLEAFTFQGHVEIAFQVEDASHKSRSITLHAKELSFQSAHLLITTKEGDEEKKEKKEKIPVEEIRLNVKATTVEFVFAEVLPSSASSSFTLVISYMGQLNNQMCGFYRSHFTDIHGTAKVMGSTQFESLDARRALPCVDEPAAKAVFQLTLIVPCQLQCFSNMPVSHQATCATTVSGKSIVKRSVQFLDTPRMSTYLLAWCVGEFDSVQALSRAGVLVQVYTPPGKSEMGKFALDCATRALDAYNEFFEVAYPLPKLDMVRDMKGL